MGRDEEVLHRRGGGRDLFDLGDLGMVRVEDSHRQDEDRRPERCFALAGEFGRIEVRSVLGQARGEELAERPPRLALDDEEPPGAQPAVVGGGGRRGEHPLEGRGVGPGSGHARRRHGPPAEQCVERLHLSSERIVNRIFTTAGQDRPGRRSRAGPHLGGIMSSLAPALAPPAACGVWALAPAPQQSHAASHEKSGRTERAAGVGPMEHGLYLEDLQPGMSAVFGKTITDADILMFAGVSGDTNPVHLNEEFAGGTVFKGRIAHGLLTASLISTAIGTKLPGPGAVYLSQTMKFLAPVRAGDTVRAIVTVKTVDLERRRVTMETVCKVGGKDVLTGEAVIMVPRRPQQEQTAAE